MNLHEYRQTLSDVTSIMGKPSHSVFLFMSSVESYGIFFVFPDFNAKRFYSFWHKIIFAILDQILGTLPPMDYTYI